MFHREVRVVPSTSMRVALVVSIALTGSRAVAQQPLTEQPAEPFTAPTNGEVVGPVGPPAPRITFQDAIQRALARNPTVAVALAEVQRSQALVQEARAGWYPTFVGTGSYTRLDHDRPRGNPVNARDEWYGALTLTVPLVAATSWAAERQAKDQAHIADLGAVEIRRLVAQATGDAYLAVIAQRLQIHSTETAIANAKSHAEYAHARLAGGIGRSIDDVRAQQDLATVLVRLQTVYTGLARAREALGVLVGAEEPVDAVETVDLGVLPTLAAALDDAGVRRSDVTQQRAKVTAAEKLRKDVWSYYAPYLAALGTGFLQKGAQMPILPEKGWQAELLLTLPLYDGGERGGLERERDATLVEARLGLDETLRQARSDVRLAFESMLRADQALASARDAAVLAKRAYDLAVLAYRAGATTNIEVLDAARQARDADSAAFAAGDIARRARLDLLVSSGHFP
jgi:outer membrane protein